MYSTQLNFKTIFQIFSLLGIFLISQTITAQVKTTATQSFNKVVVSPHIEVVFVKGTNESVTIESSTEPTEKINIEVDDNTLELYLDDAKVFTKSKKQNKNGYDYKVPIYKGTVVRATVTYKNLETLDLRGEENFTFKSKLDAEELRMSIYGESQVTMNQVNINNLKVSIYGESYLKVDAGKIENQKITAYGESTVNTLSVDNAKTKLTAYGDGTFQFKVSERLGVTSYGEATINYKGDPELKRGLIIGETKITKVNY